MKCQIIKINQENLFDAGLILFNTKQLLYTVSTEVIIDCPMKFRWEASSPSSQTPIPSISLTYSLSSFMCQYTGGRAWEIWRRLTKGLVYTKRGRGWVPNLMGLWQKDGRSLKRQSTSKWDNLEPGQESFGNKLSSFFFLVSISFAS